MTAVRKEPLILGSIRKYLIIESMKISSFKKISEVTVEYLRFQKICGLCGLATR